MIYLPLCGRKKLCYLVMLGIWLSWYMRAAHAHCETSQFTCKDGSCILLEKMCDGRSECADGSDEVDCDARKCRKPKWFQCAQPQGPCLSADLLCNGVENCPGGEDEHDCGGRMRGGVGVSASSSINSKKVKWKINRNCSEYEYTCQTNRACIPLDFMCDGKSDCHDNSDEVAGCLQAAATCTGFYCANKHCLPKASWRCDGVDDCGDGSDEHNCADRDCVPEHNKFLCNDNSTCLVLSQACDGKTDCLDRSDESEHCTAATNNCSSRKCPPAAKCIMLPSNGSNCLCPHGFRYSALQNACVDIDECNEVYGICSQGCENTSGGYRCTCDEAYLLLADNRSCEAYGHEPLLLYTTKIAVMGMHLRSQRLYTVTKNLSEVIGVAYDGKHIYWTSIQNEAESIVRANADGSNREILLTSGLDAPEDLAVDWYTGNIYFTDNVLHHIAVCSNDGVICTVLVTIDVHHPRGIALWPQKGQMFWTDWGTKPMIARAFMDGNHMMPLVTENINWPNGITLDMHNNRVYWVDAKSSTVESIRPDGSDRRTVLEGILKHPYGLAIFEDRLYWSDWGTKSLHSCNKFTGKDHRVLSKDRTMYAIHIYHPSKQLNADTHPCTKTRCSHLCLLSEQNRFSCACPDGMQLAADHLRCIKTQKRQRLFIAIRNTLLEMEHTNFGRHVILESHHLSLYIHEMAYNSVNGSVFMADNNQRIIYEFDLNGKTLYSVVHQNLGNVTGMAFDHLARNLYWTDSERHVIEVYSLLSRQRAIVRFFSGVAAPIGITLVPDDGVMFIALRNKNQVYIDQMLMSGRGTPAHAIEYNLGYDIKFAVDFDLRTIYWSDTYRGSISFSDYRNVHPHIFRNRLRRPYAIVVVDEDVFWSSIHSSTIHWTHKTNLGPVKSVQIETVPDGVTHAQSLPAKIPLLASTHSPTTDHPCQHNNGDCSHVCVAASRSAVACMCPAGLVFRDATNRSCIEILDCEFRCRSGECLTQAHRCNNRKDCPDNSDEEHCSPTDAKQKKVICPLNKFMCHNAEQCVANDKRCDGNNDCRDGSDEEHCDRFDKTKQCHSHQHLCQNRHCVDLSAVCDGVDDCGDHSDEENCKEIVCDAKMFRCNSGTCIASSWECDGKLDCTDGSDEHDKCSLKDCPSGMHKCGLGQCIDGKLVCDDHNDCGDSSDELNCDDINGTRSRGSCGNETVSMFECASGPKMCLEMSAKCNGTAECPRGEDEADCGNVCSVYEFKCRTGEQCIRLEFRCDRDMDCADGSDEQHCENHNANSTMTAAGTPPHERPCEANMFDCKDGLGCVENTRVCDDFADCENGADEGPMCKSACRTIGNGRPVCEQKCRPTPTGAVCSCYQGYQLDADQRHCTDIDECQLDAGACAQLCENTHGSYRCSCYPDFMLRPDKITCKSIESEAALLFSTYDEVRAMTEEPITLRVLWSANDSKIHGFDVDVRRRFAYFSTDSEDIIYQLNMTSGAVVQALAMRSPSRMAVDWVTGNIYAISRAQQYSIHVCSFEKRMCGRIVEAISRQIIRALAVDGYNKRLFYATTRPQGFDLPRSQITIAHLDGRKREELLVRDGALFNAIAVDPHKRQLYFVDAHTHTLQTISYKTGASNSPITLVSKGNVITHPSGLAIYENQAFIVNTGVKEAVRCQLYGLRQCLPFNLNILNAEEILVDGISRQPLITNPCTMAGCDGMCVPTDYSYACMCAGTFVNENAQCAKSATNAIVDSALLRGGDSGEKTSPDNGAASSHTFLISLCVLVVILALVGIGYYYYRRLQQGHRDFNINLHFQNPLSSLGKHNNQKTATIRSNDSATTTASFEQDRAQYGSAIYRYVRGTTTAGNQSSGSQISLKDIRRKRSGVQTLESDGFLLEDESSGGGDGNDRNFAHGDDIHSRLLP